MPPAPPLVPGPAPKPVVLHSQSSGAAQTYKKIIYGIGFGALGLALTAVIVTAAVCGSSKCKSGSHIDE